MEPHNLRSILAAKFKANDAYELKLWEQLDVSTREMTKNLCDEQDFYGLLVPRTGATVTLKSACQQTALLFLSLQSPSELPLYIRKKFGEECNQAITQLVLDGILQIEFEGELVTGVAARDAVYQQPSQSNEPNGKIEELSLSALKFAQELQVTESYQLSSFLYNFNRLPVTSVWRDHFPTSINFGAYFDFAGNAALNKSLKQGWSYSAPQKETDGWHSWARYSAGAQTSSSAPTFKLYISPSPDALRSVFDLVVPVITQSKAFSFKMGKDVFGILRPDKLVVYFEDFAGLQTVAQELQPVLSAFPGQGVPFTAALTSDGMLSWGIDPPTAYNSSIWSTRESWRLWVTNRLAVALLAARVAPQNSVPPYQFALERLRLDGVDTTTWTPVESIWANN